MNEYETIQSFFVSLATQATELLQADTASIWFIEGDIVKLAATTGFDIIIEQDLHYTIGEGLTGYIAQGHAFRGTWDSIKNHPAWKGKWDDLQWKRPPENLSALMGVPIVLEGKPIGVLKVENKKGGGPFAESDQKLLESLAYLIATAVKNRPDLATEALGPYVFVLMPFSDEFRDIYDLGIKSTAEKLGMRCERVDEIEFNDTILAQIYDGIQRSDLVIADMTGRNPNVFYEVGYAHALSRDVVLLTQKSEDIPFDLKGHNHIIYGKSITTLKERLEKRLLVLVEKLRK
jgi:hypothetical protein